MGGKSDESWSEMEPKTFEGCHKWINDECLNPGEIKYYQSPVYGNLEAVNDIYSGIKEDATNELSKRGTFSNEETLINVIAPRPAFLYGSFIEWVNDLVNSE